MNEPNDPMEPVEPAEPAEPVLIAEGITKRYPTPAGLVTVIDGFDHTLHSGELVALHGPSGSGKTAIVHLLAGWEQPDEGHISWPLALLRRGRTPSWSQVAVIPQTLALLDELSVAENITLPQRASNPRPHLDAESAQMVERLGLTHLLDRVVDQISVGEQQRVMIARALAARPAIILADEPTGHQDDRNADIVAALLLEAVHDGAACLIATRQTSLRALARHAGISHRTL